MRKLAGHTTQPKGKSGLTKNQHSAGGSKAGVNFQPGSTTIVKKAGYERGAHQLDVNFSRTGMSKGPGTSSYQSDAHTKTHHGGYAMGGMPEQAPMSYQSQTFSEGRPIHGANEGPNYVPAYSHGTTNKAAHHPRTDGKHVFPNATGSAMAHGFGHSVAQRVGPLRHSGHPGAHRIGKPSSGGMGLPTNSAGRHRIGSKSRSG